MTQCVVSHGLGDVRPRSPEWLSEFPVYSRLIDRLGVIESRRRLFHMAPALLPSILPFIPHPDVWGPILISLLVIFSILALVIAAVFRPLLVRKRERNWNHAVFGYLLPVVLPLLLFPGRAELGLMTLQILALGDGSATVGGILLGGRKLPWNPQKTFSGLICFAIIGSVAATYSFWGESRPGVPIGTAFLICGVAAVCAGIVESLPIRSNDNFRVGTTALLVGLLMSASLS